MSFVVLELVRQLALVAKHQIVYEREAGYPVAVLGLAVTLYVVLTAGEVPHEIPPVHEVALV